MTPCRRRLLPPAPGAAEWRRGALGRTAAKAHHHPPWPCSLPRCLPVIVANPPVLSFPAADLAIRCGRLTAGGPKPALHRPSECPETSSRPPCGGPEFCLLGFTHDAGVCQQLPGSPFDPPGHAVPRSLSTSGPFLPPLPGRRPPGPRTQNVEYAATTTSLPPPYFPIP